MKNIDEVKIFLNSEKPEALTIDSFVGYPKKYQWFGLLIGGLTQKSGNSYTTKEYYRKRVSKDIKFNPFSTAEGNRLAQQLFVEAVASYAKKIWDGIIDLPYQNGYYRKPFRCKDEITYINQRINIFRSIHSKSKLGFKDLSIKEWIRYDVYDDSYLDISDLFSSAMEDSKNGIEHIELVRNIISGEDEIGGVSKSIICALLKTNKKDNWELV